MQCVAHYIYIFTQWITNTRFGFVWWFTYLQSYNKHIHWYVNQHGYDDHERKLNKSEIPPGLAKIIVSLFFTIVNSNGKLSTVMHQREIWNDFHICCCCCCFGSSMLRVVFVIACWDSTRCICDEWKLIHLLHFFSYLIDAPSSWFSLPFFTLWNHSNHFHFINIYSLMQRNATCNQLHFILYIVAWMVFKHSLLNCLGEQRARANQQPHKHSWIVNSARWMYS